MDIYYQKLNDLLRSKIPFVSCIVVDTTGSVPQDAGSKMLVTESGLQQGTVGGGKVEKRAIEECLLLLQKREHGKHTHFVNWSLSKDIGMTCGGMVKLFFEVHNTGIWQIAVFGAGHVANAVINLLCKVECKITCIDPRQEWLDKLPDSEQLTKLKTDDMPSAASKLADDSFVLLITMGHSTDSPILTKILSTRTFPYLGVIGSEAKAIRLKQDLAAAGLSQEKADAFFCPMGLPLGNNHPQEIAISIVSQLLQERDRFFTNSKQT